MADRPLLPRFAGVGPANDHLPRRETCDETEVRALASQLVAALHYCHEAQASKETILHRDLKPENGAQNPLKVHAHHRTDRRSILYGSVVHDCTYAAACGLWPRARYERSPSYRDIRCWRKSCLFLRSYRLLERADVVGAPLQTPGYLAPVRGIVTIPFDRLVPGPVLIDFRRLWRTGGSARLTLRSKSRYVLAWLRTVRPLLPEVRSPARQTVPSAAPGRSY